MNPDPPCSRASEASLQQRHFNAVDSWGRANAFCWWKGPQEILLVSLAVKCVIPTWVYGRPLPSFPPWGFLLVRPLLSCLGYCKKGKNCSGLREMVESWQRCTHRFVSWTLRECELLRFGADDTTQKPLGNLILYLFCWNLDGFLICLPLLTLSVYST